jgi:hypothetical protein
MSRGLEGLEAVESQILNASENRIERSRKWKRSTYERDVALLTRLNYLGLLIHQCHFCGKQSSAL